MVSLSVMCRKRSILRNVFMQKENKSPVRRLRISTWVQLHSQRNNIFIFANRFSTLTPSEIDKIVYEFKCWIIYIFTSDFLVCSPFTILSTQILDAPNVYSAWDLCWQQTRSLGISNNGKEKFRVLLQMSRKLWSSFRKTIINCNWKLKSIARKLNYISNLWPNWDSSWQVKNFTSLSIEQFLMQIIARKIEASKFENPLYALDKFI